MKKGLTYFLISLLSLLLSAYIFGRLDRMHALFDNQRAFRHRLARGQREGDVPAVYRIGE